MLTIDEPIDKDSSCTAGALAVRGRSHEPERKAFLFRNIVDGRGRKYSIPVVVGAIAANRAIYSVGMGARAEEIQAK